ncbi:MAG: SurA N-terminal domain-containing protein [Sphingopyxis sp.]|nr:SurA N-terminal domain-containing protein [Sphingopyxis sp.]
MITSIRRAVTSKVGAIVALIFLAVVGLSFALADVNSVGGGSGVDSGNVMRVGDRQVSMVEVRRRLDQMFQREQQQNPGLTLQAFVAGGALDRVIKEMGDLYALEQFAEANGIGIDKAAVDAMIAANPNFRGLDGNFSQAAFEAALRQNNTTPAQMRADLESGSRVRQLIAPFASVPSVPNGIVNPYTALLLERREGQATFVSSASLAPRTDPTDAQLTAFYTAQRARYTIPERRALRIALLDESAVRTPPAVTDAEIAAEFRANAAQYAAREQRQFSQVVAGTQAIAARIAAAARSGGSLASAAQAAGLSASPIAAETREQMTSATSAAVAQAAFAAQQGQVIGPLQVDLGWIVLRADRVERTPARTLAQVSDELRTRLATRKRQEAMVDIFNQIQTALTAGATVSEIASDRGLRLVTTPALLPNGIAPGQPDFRPDPTMAPVLAAAFQAHEGDPAQIVTLEPNRVFALVEVASTVAAAPPPLASVRPAIVNDWRLQQGSRAARDRARRIAAAVEGGQSLSAAASANGAARVQSIGGVRINASNPQRRTPPEIALLFSMPPGSVKTLELPGNAGWMVLRLNRSERGNPAEQEQLQNSVRQQMGGALGSEYLAALVAAARARYPVTVDQPTVTSLRAQLTGTAPSGL